MLLHIGYMWKKTGMGQNTLPESSDIIALIISLIIAENAVLAALRLLTQSDGQE